MLSIKTIKSKLELSLTGLLSIPLIIIIISFVFISRQNAIDEAQEILVNINLEINEARINTKDFIDNDAINPLFFQHKSSIYLNNFKESIDKTRNKINELEKKSVIISFGIQYDLESFKNQIILFENQFDSIADKVFDRGFKQYGIEGRMRRYIHQIEEPKYSLDDGALATLLMIRRHEKDFIIRKESRYEQKLKQSVEVMRSKVKAQSMSIAQQQTLLTLLDEYESTFEDLVAIEKEIGFDNGMGLKRGLEEISTTIGHQIDLITSDVAQRVTRLKTSMSVTLGAMIGGCLVLFIVLIFQISRFVSTPIATLSTSIREVVENKFERGVEVYQPDTQDEIALLASDFGFMLHRVQALFDEIQEKSQKVQEQNEAIVSSLRYAQTIQEAILPPKEELDELFDDHFVIYEPQQMVSGDFYWALKRKKKLWVAVIDCTGHGVPGAFMSMIGHTLMNEIVSQQKIHDPALILEALHLEIVGALKQNRSKNTDGMDVCLCLIEKDEDQPDTRFITFAGAKSPLYYTKDHQLQARIVGSRKAIGGVFKDDDRKFENNEFTLTKGDILYLTSDGYVDQNNDKRQRIGSQNFIKLLEEIHTKPLEDQKKALQEHLIHHQGEELQRDDITILAVRV